MHQLIPLRCWLSCYRAPSLGLFRDLCLPCLVSLPLTAGTASRAAEPIRCVGSDAAAHLGYVDDVREQVPSEDDKAAAHHHGSCQGEQVGEPEKEGFATQDRKSTRLNSSH